MSDDEASDSFPILDAVGGAPARPRPAKQLQPLSLSLVKTLNPPQSSSSLSDDEIADALLAATSLHLEFANICGPVQSLDCFSNLTEV